MRLYDSDPSAYSDKVITWFEGDKEGPYDDTIFTTFKGARRETIRRLIDEISHLKLALDIAIDLTCEKCPKDLNPFTDI